MAPSPTALDAARPLAAAFAAAGATTWEAAVALVHALPYGRPAGLDLAAPLTEGRGTCSGKHALLAALGAEAGLPVELRLGLFLMDATTHPAVGPILAEADLDAVPEAHCWIRVGGPSATGTDVDVTFPGRSAPLPPMLVEISMAPAAVSTAKVGWHRELLGEWALAQGLDPDAVWSVREACIAAMTTA